MKKALRVIILLVLILAVIACSAWYLMVYDREFTKEMLLSHARSLEASGKYDAAAFVYDLAYFQSSHEDNIALELAEQYRSMGNYTKAERTLYSAISTNPTTQLYIFLCKLYVEQDKLLDAVNMLDAIADPAIKAELNALRPATPAPSLEPGFYSQYISVGLESINSTVYVNTKGDYPSTETDAYTEPISLPLGESRLCCISVSEEGLVSPVGNYQYTIGGVVEVVTFQDPAIEAQVRRQLEVDEKITLFTNDLWAVKEFHVPADATNFSDLALLTRLESISATEAAAGVLAALNSESIRRVSMLRCKISSADLQAISSFQDLTYLALSDCGISTVAKLSDLTNLEYLDLRNNSLRNLSALRKMTKLKTLYLGSNAVTNLEDLSALTNLEVLDISYNSIPSLAPLSKIKGLKELDASHNKISSIRDLADMTQLVELNLAFNTVSDVSALKGCVNMEMLDISNNAVSDISMLDGLLLIHTLNFANNQVAELPVFNAACQLVSINGSNNLITTLDSLAGLRYLNTVNMDHNADLESLEPLDSCPVLIKVNAYGTKVTEVTFLTEKSIVVNFDPTLEKE